MKIHHTC